MQTVVVAREKTLSCDFLTYVIIIKVLSFCPTFGPSEKLPSFLKIQPALGRERM